jgi:[acyl-carrier-protein] S-malonyltransferase
MDNLAFVSALPTADEKFALVFPGQGSQYIGMGQQLYERFTVARSVFQQAEDVLGIALAKLCFEGPADALDDTVNAQPAIFTVSIAALEVLRERYQALGQQLTPIAVAGHSLGEYSALVAAGALDFSDGLQLVQERGRLMKEAGAERPGGMAAVLGLDRDALSALCLEASKDGGIVVLANDNCPGQSVISGEVVALERAMSLALREGARKAVRLGISIASHSPLMERAGQQLSLLLDRVHLHEPVVPIVSNITGKVSGSVDELRRNLQGHVVRPVMWNNSVGSMLDSGVTTFVEVGPGNVLSGLIRRVKRDARTLTLNDLIPMNTNS